MNKTQQSERNSDEKQNIPRLVRNFLSYTTAHGFSRLESSKGIPWKIFWALVCMGSFAMFTYQVRGLFVLYLSRPITTSVKITFEKQVPFPAVTICNLNMLRTRKMPEELNAELLNLAGVQNQPSSKDTQKPGLNPLPTTKPPTTKSDPVTNTYLSSTTWNPVQKTPDGPYYDTSACRPGHRCDGENRAYPSEKEINKNSLLLEKFTTAVTKYPIETLTLAGHQLEDLVTECTWRGYNCSKDSNYSSWWFSRWHYKYGNCYTFNGGINEDYEPVTVLSTSKSGPSQGLSLRLNIQQEEYLKYVSDEAGVRVILHDQGMMPFPYLEGFSVSPKTATSVSIQKTVITRVDRFSNHTCWDIDQLYEDNIYRKFYQITKYTPQTCQNSCVGKTQLDKCGCSEYSYPSNTSACDAFNSSIRECLWKIHNLFNEDQLPCMEECRKPCRENVIQKTISMSQWPSLPYQAYEKEQNHRFSSDSSLLLNIFYNELNYQRIEESFTYDEINLLADIGGQLGLWVGVSVITVFELIELFALILTRLFAKRRTTVVKVIGYHP